MPLQARRIQHRIARRHSSVPEEPKSPPRQALTRLTYVIVAALSGAWNGWALARVFERTLLPGHNSATAVVFADGWAAAATAIAAGLGVILLWRRSPTAAHMLAVTMCAMPFFIAGTHLIVLFQTYGV